MTKKNKDTKDTLQSKKIEGERILHVDSHTLHLTHPDKVYFPEDKLTKGDVIDYYHVIYKYIGPYLNDRPESLRRQPNGISDEGFFQKDMDSAPPSWVKTRVIHSETEDRNLNYMICNDQATLLYMINLGCIEINPWFSRINHLDNPDYVVIDIDPSSENTFDQVIEAALAVKEVLDRAGIQGYCKTSGATGLHVFVPLGARYNYDHAKDFSHIIAVMAHELAPNFTTVERSLGKRGNKIYMDYLQNRRGQTLASAYSLRPRSGAPVSTPLAWNELKKGLHPSQFTIHTLPRRLEKIGDIFHPVLEKGIDIQKALKKLGA
ncbi:MAG: non-homologous end-joining DNA ligase [Candidatus Omnitrophota bacterium]